MASPLLLLLLSLSSSSFSFFFFIISIHGSTMASADVAADRAECSPTLAELSTCLSYVEDKAKAPTPDCCSGLADVLSKSKKCLCLLIKDHDSPDIGIKINATKAVFLPSACNVPANISNCPHDLDLPPNSKDAAIFEQFGRGHDAAGSAANTTEETTNSEKGPDRSATMAGQTVATNSHRLPAGGKTVSTTLFALLFSASALLYFN